MRKTVCPLCKEIALPYHVCPKLLHPPRPKFVYENRDSPEERKRKMEEAIKLADAQADESLRRMGGDPATFFGQQNGEGSSKSDDTSAVDKKAPPKKEDAVVTNNESAKKKTELQCAYVLVLIPNLTINELTEEEKIGLGIGYFFQIFELMYILQQRRNHDIFHGFIHCLYLAALTYLTSLFR